MSDLFPYLGFIGALAIILGVLGFLRYRNYQKMVKHAENGFPYTEPKIRSGFLRWGIVLTGLGLALSLGLYSIGFATGEDYPLHFGPWMLGGFVPLSLGLSLILLYLLAPKE